MPKTRMPKISISRDTTYITGPLRVDGYVDYLAALNEYCSQGVTLENNAAIPFIKTVGPKELDKEIRQKYFKLLGIAELSDEGPYLVPMEEFILNYKGWKVSDSDTPEAQKWWDEIWNQFEEASKRPWSKEEFPVLAALLEKNSEHLDKYVKATRLSRCYAPLISKDGTLLNCNYGNFGIIGCREITRELLIRSLLQVHLNDIDKARDDILACYYSARLVSQGPLFIDWMVAVSLDGMARSGTISLANQRYITAEQARRFQEDLHKLPPMRPIQIYWDKGERLFALGALLDIALHGYQTAPPSSYNEEMLAEWKKIYEPLNNAIQKLDNDPRVDWDEAFKYINDWYDRITEAYAKPTVAQRKEAIARLQTEYSELSKQALDNTSATITDLETVPAKSITRQFMILLMNIGLVSGCQNAFLLIENKQKVYSDFSFLTLALAGYHHDRGSYPNNLAELCPKFIGAIPKDVFNDEEYHYKIEKNGYLLYSVGPNGKDDGGKNFLQDMDWTNYDDSKYSEEEKTADDIAIRVPPKKNK